MILTDKTLGRVKIQENNRQIRFQSHLMKKMGSDILTCVYDLHSKMATLLLFPDVTITS